MLQRKPMTALYEAVRRFLEHPQDDVGRAELDYHLGLYEAEAPNGSGSSWCPHPLNLHPPPTAESQAAYQRMIQGYEDLCGARIKVDPARVQHAVEVVARLSADLKLDHVYCLYLLRAVSHEDLRVWIEGKVQPASAFFDEYSAAAQAQAQQQLGMGMMGQQQQQQQFQQQGGQLVAAAQGGQMAMMMPPSPPRALREDVEAAARYLFFIEKRNALNALLELVQARMGVGLSEAKQHAVMSATDALIGQGLPAVLMRRVEWVSREVKCRGRSPLEVEFEVERQKAADCLFFLFYQTQMLPRELLPLGPQQTPAAPPTALLPAGQAPSGSAPPTLLGLVKFLTEELRRKFGATAPGEEQHKSREERALYKALTTLLMTLVTAFITTDGLLPRPGGGNGTASQSQQPQRNALIGYILEEGGVNAAIAARQAYEREHKAQQGARGPDGERRVKEKETAHRDALGRVKETLQRLRGEVEGGWANAGVQAVVLLAWGALLRDADLGERLAYAGLERWLAEARRDLLARAVGQGVFGFMEGALVGCWRRPQQEDVRMFFLDVTVELLSVYLRAPHEVVRSLPGYGRRPAMSHDMHGMGQGAGAAAADAGEQRKAAVEALISLIVRVGEAHQALAERLLWAPPQQPGGELEPMQFVKDVSELVKHDAGLRAGWIQLLAAMAAAPPEECKLATVDFLTDYSPFADARRRPLDVLTYVLEDSRARAEQNQPLQRDYLMGALLVIERVTCPALARDRELGFVPHVLPQLLALLNYPLPMEPKGALLKALAAFAALPDGEARQLWEQLEAMRILPGRGRRELLRRELEEVETRQASYPITEGFVTLLTALLKGDVPHTLGEGMGTRPEGEGAGVQPYIDYLVEDVLLPIRGRPHADAGQRWKVAAKALEALVLVLERYPLVPDDDRLRNLGLDGAQRRLAKEQVYRDVDTHPGPPSPGFRLLLRLLAAPTAAAAGPGGEGQLLPLLLDIVAAHEPATSPSSSGLRGSLLASASAAANGGNTAPYHDLLHHAGEDLPLGPWRLEHKARLRECRAWDEAVRAFDAEEEPPARPTPRWEVAEDEARWQEACVRNALELLTNACVRDGEFRRLYAEMPEHPYFRGFRVASLNDLVYRGGSASGAGATGGKAGSVAAQKHRRALAQGRMLPLIAEYVAYEPSPALRLQAALLFRELVARFPQPQELLDAFRPAAQQQHDHFHYDVGGGGGGNGAAARAVDAVVRTLSHAGELVESSEGNALLELGSLQSSLNLLTKLRRAAAVQEGASAAGVSGAAGAAEPAGPSAGQVDRIAHFLLLDTLLHAFLPHRATLPHLLLGYRPADETAATTAMGDGSGSSGGLSLPTDPAGSVFGLQLLVRNLASPAFLTGAPLLAERACELVFRLVAAGKTAPATLAYLQRDDVDFFAKELALLTLRPFPTPPRYPTASAAAGLMGSPLGEGGGGRRGSLNAAQEQQQQLLRTYFRAQVGYASALHVWAWLLKAAAVALTHPRGDPSKARRLLEALIAAPPAATATATRRASAGASPGAPLEPHQDFETRGMTLTELLLRLQLAHQQEAPQPPNEELRALAERCAAPMGGPPEIRAFHCIVHDSFLNQVRSRLGAAAGVGGAAGQAGQGAADMLGSPPLGRPGAAATAGGGATPGGAGGAGALRVLQEAAQYALRYNHFLLRQAGEFHFCAAWRRLAEAVLLEAEAALVAAARPGRGLGSGGQEDLKVVLPLVAQAASKLTRTPFADGQALEEVAAVVMAGAGVVHRYARSRPEGIPEAALSVDEGQRLLELMLAALLRMGAGGGGAEAAQPAQRKYRMQLYAALILYLRATTLAPLPEPAGGKPLLLTSGGGGAVGAEEAAWRSGSSLVGLRREKNADTLAHPRFLGPLVEALVADAAYAPSLGSRARARHQGLAAAALGLVLESLYTAGAPEGPLLPLGVAPSVGRYDAAVQQTLGRLSRLLDDLEPQFCVERPPRTAAVNGVFASPPPPPATRSLAERPGDLALGYYLTLLIQVAQDVRGAKALLDRGVVEKLGRARFLAVLEDGDAPTPHAQDRERLLAGVGGVLRLLDVMLARLPLNADLRAQADAFLRAHARTLVSFVESRQHDLEGLEEVGAAVALLAHNVGTKGSGIMGRAAPPPSLAPVQDEYRRLVTALFERFGMELLPPLAVRFQVRTQGWWAEVEEPPETGGIPCEPPPGVSPTYAWRVGDALKLLVSQTLLLHTTTYIRRRLRKARFPNLRVETVLVSLRMALTFLAAQGEGPAPPVPAYSDVRRAALLLQAPGGASDGGDGAHQPQQKAPWDYGYLRTSLRRLFESLLDILYHLVCDRVETDPDFPKAQVHAELLKALQGHDAWLERQMQQGAWPHLRMTLDSIQDRLRV